MKEEIKNKGAQETKKTKEIDVMKQMKINMKRREGEERKLNEEEEKIELQLSKKWKTK